MDADGGENFLITRGEIYRSTAGRKIDTHGYQPSYPGLAGGSQRCFDIIEKIEVGMAVNQIWQG